jgi:prepilin-type N-terminal cleavage/methylation domain-containing protein
MKKRGFTLVELLVVIAIIALLMGILMPALARVRQIAFRMVCGTNLSGIGKAMLIYSNDYDDELPRAGGRNSTWAAALPVWNATNRFQAYGLATDGSGGRATISSCFYLLVKYAEVTPKSFICKGDSGTNEFKPADAGAGDRELIDLWDFGPEPNKKCSYSYHKPFGLYALTTASEPGLAVAADRNPWIASPAGAGKTSAQFAQFIPTGGRDIIKIGNAIQHQEDGQNVLFLDNHVNFEKNAFCGINDDNVYTSWGAAAVADPRKGVMPAAAIEPMDRTDSYLVHDDTTIVSGGGGGTPAPKGRTCFTAETPVWINGASVQISAAAQSIGKQICGTSSLERVDEHTGTFDVRDVVLETGNCISVVDAHCFMLASGQWINAPNLTSGMTLKTANGTVGIKSVTLRAMPYVGKVYNLKVEGSDQYTVGQDQVVVRDY